MSAEKLIAKAKETRAYFTPEQLTELKKILKHNDASPRDKRVSGEAAAEFFGLSYGMFRKAVRLALGRNFGGAK